LSDFLLFETISLSMTPLSHLSIGQKAKICQFETHAKISRRFMEMGLRINDKIQIIEKLWGGNLIILSKHGKYVLRRQEAHLIQTQF